MIRTRSRKILRDIWARRGRTFLVSTAIFIGVIGTIALFSMGDILVRQLREDIKEDELSMLDVAVTVSSGAELDNEAYLRALREVTGVTDVVGYISGPIQFKINPDDAEFTDGFINAYSAPFDQLSIEPMRLIDGNYPKVGANEIAIEQRMADKYMLKVGDPIQLRVLSPSRDESLDGAVGTTETWTVSGIVFHAYAGSGGGPVTVTPAESLYAQAEDASYIAGSTGYGAFRARFVDFPTAEAEAQAFATILADDTPYIPFFTLTQDPAENSLVTGAQTISGTMGFLAMVALIVSGFLVINVISSIIVEQKRQIGVMKSLGATRGDNVFIYSGIALVYGLIGVIPGVILGIPAGNAAAHALAPQVNTLLKGFQISPSSILTGVIVGLLVPVVSALIPVYFGTRVKILEAMTDLGIDARYGTGPIARLISILPIPITIRQGLANVSLKKSRLLFTVITLSIAAGAFMGIFAVFDSLTGGINIFLNTFNVEVGVFPNETRDPEEFLGLMRDNYQTPENNIFASVEPGFNIQVEFEGYTPAVAAGGPPGIFAYGFDVTSPTPAFNLTVDRGDPLDSSNADTGIALSSVLAANMGKDLGDTVIIKVPGNSAEFTIVGISNFPLDQVWMDWRTIARLTGYTSGAPKANEYLTTVMVPRYAGSLPDNQVSMIGLDTQYAAFIPFSTGEFFTPGEPGVIISQQMADNGGYTAGEMITLTAQTETGKSAEYPIVGIFTLPPMLQSEMESQGVGGDIAGMFWKDLADLEGLSLDGKPIPQGYFLVTTYEKPTADQISDIIDDLDEKLLENGISAYSFNFVELIDTINQSFIVIQVILQLVAGLIALVGALGLLTTLSMSVFERQKEIGVMRSIGAGSGTVALQFLTEGIVVGLIAWLIGIPLAYGIEVMLLDVTGFGEVFSAVFPLSAAIIGFVGMMIITIIASLWPSLSAARKTVSQIIRYQ